MEKYLLTIGQRDNVPVAGCAAVAAGVADAPDSGAEAVGVVESMSGLLLEEECATKGQISTGPSLNVSNFPNTFAVVCPLNCVF
jgi:hypothetical protein